MLLRHLPALALTFASVFALAKDSRPYPANAPVPSGPEMREPRLILPQTGWVAQGECGNRRQETARVSLEIAVDGTAQHVKLLDVTDSKAGELAVQVVRADRFTAAQQNGKAVAQVRSILVEMNLCADPTKFWFESQPKQTLDPLGLIFKPGSLGVYKVGGRVSVPVPLNTPEAEYTDQARKVHIEGQEMITIIVDTNGVPQRARVVRRLGYGLDEKAIEAVRKYRFRPATLDKTVPVPVLITIAVNFTLYDKPALSLPNR